MKKEHASRAVPDLTRPACAVVFDLLRAVPPFSASVCRDVGRWCRWRTGTLNAGCSSLQRAASDAWSNLSMRLEGHPMETAPATLPSESLSYLFFLALIVTTFLV